MSSVPTLQEFQRELVDIAQTYQLMHCRSLISVQQYLPAYRLVREHVPIGGRVLDWGTGNGHFSYFLTRSGYRTSGLGFGIAPPVCSRSEAGQYDYRAATDPVILPYDSAVFDAVVSIGVLEHVRETGGDELASLREIRRVLKPSGAFVCVHFPNRYSWIDFVASTLGWPGHEFKYTRGDILSMNAESGLKIVKMGRNGALPRNVWSRDVLRPVGSWAPAAAAYGLLDRALATVFGLAAHNHWFVATPA